MKQIKITLLIIGLLQFINYSSAAIITVNNNNPSPGQYSSLQAAIDAALAGDTLLIHRSTTSYGNVNITKRLVIIGEGALPNKSPLSASILGTVTLTYNTTTLENASKSRIVGLDITTLSLSQKSIDPAFAVDSITIMNCRINTMTLKNAVYSLTCLNNIIFSISGAGNTATYNSLFKYNLINSYSTNTSFGTNNVMINNIFFTKLSFNSGIVANNIFYDTEATAFSMASKNVIFSNNIFYSVSVAFNPADFVANGNSSSNNQFNVDPLLVSPISMSIIRNYAHTSPASGPFADFHLQPTSPAINAGTDGTDLGLYGGTTPWHDGSTTDSRYRYFPLPDAVPVITGVTVQNPVVNQGGTLQIQINATTQP